MTKTILNKINIHYVTWDGQDNLKWDNAKYFGGKQHHYATIGLMTVQSCFVSDIFLYLRWMTSNLHKKFWKFEEMTDYIHFLSQLTVPETKFETRWSLTAKLQSNMHWFSSSSKERDRERERKREDVL